MKKIAVFLADGFEEIEALTPIDMCRRAGIDVTTISIKDDLNVMGSHKIPVRADSLFEDVNYDDYDMLLLPGGGLGTQNLESCDKLLALLKKADKDGKFLSAICAAPRVLGNLGLLEGKKATCYPGNEEHLKGATYVPDKAVLDGRFVTARGMGASIEFASLIITQLSGSDKAEEIEKQIQFK